MNSGIYAIWNIVNGKVYIGSAINLQQRKRNHLTNLRGGYHKNRHLQFAFDKYTEQVFVFDVIELVSNLDNLIVREQHYLDLLKAYDRNIGYNIASIAGSCLGVKHTKETKENMRIAQTGKKRSSEARKNQSIALKGRVFSDGHRRKLSERQRGELNHAALFTWEQVREIRRIISAKEQTQKELAGTYGVSRYTIGDIVRYKRWKHDPRELKHG